MSELRDSGIWTLEGTWKVLWPSRDFSLWKEFVRFSFFSGGGGGQRVSLGSRERAGPGSMQHRAGHLAEAVQVTLYRYARDTPSPQDTLNSLSPFPPCPHSISTRGPSHPVHHRRWSLCDAGLRNCPHPPVARWPAQGTGHGGVPSHQVLRCTHKGRDLLTFSSGSNG